MARSHLYVHSRVPARRVRHALVPATTQLPSASLYARRKERTGAIVNSIEL